MDWHSVKIHFKNTWLTTLMSLLLFLGVTYFLLWTESQTIQSNIKLEELIKAARSIDVHTKDDPSHYEGQVVHIIGPIHVLEPISEPEYNIQVLAVKLRKRVQMYQWIEESKETESYSNVPGEEMQRDYYYHKEWRDDIVDSSSFYIRAGHQNPSSMPVFSETHIADSVRIGWLYLGPDVKRKVNDYYEIWSDTRPDRSDIKLHSGFYYHGESALEHQIGDLRVHFSYAGRQDDIYTTVGVVESGVLQSYSPESFPSADPISLLRKGSFSLKQLYELEKHDANVHTWKYRFLGFFQVFASAMTLHPDWLTLFLQGQWVSSNLRRSSRVWVNLVISFSYTLIVTSIPWFVYKPFYGAMILGGAAMPLVHYSTLMTRRDRERSPHSSHRPQYIYRNTNVR